MKGKHLVIGVLLFTIAVVAAIYFMSMATFNNHENGMEPIVENMELVVDGSFYLHSAGVQTPAERR